MEEVTLRLVVKQMANGETETNTYSYQGRAVAKGSAYYFTYKEELEGAGEVSTILKVEDLKVSLIRQGSVQMKQQFEKGKSYESTYTGSFGMMRMETHTRQLRITQANGRPDLLAVNYQLWMGEQYIGEFDLELKINWHG